MYPFITKFALKNWSAASLLKVLDYQGPYAIWESSSERNRKKNYSTHQPARFSHLIINPSKIISLKDNFLSIESENDSFRKECFPQKNNPLEFLESQLKLDYQLSPLEQAKHFQGGLVGFLSYDLARYFEKIKGLKVHTEEPELYFLLSYGVIVFDNLEKSISLISTPINWESKESCQEKHLFFSKVLQNILKNNTPQIKTCNETKIEFVERYSQKEFISMVNSCKEYISAGDIFQGVLSNSFSSNISPDPLILFETLKEINPSVYHFAIRFQNSTLVGASPEVFIQNEVGNTKDTTIKMRLIAGTYPKGENEPEQITKAEELISDDKELAEHLMLVDHVRNDIGKVSKIASVEVRDMFSVETLANIHHIVSQVKGILRPELTIYDAIESCFPIATLTGTPKIRAMEIIAELENQARGIFGGSIATIGFDQKINSAVAIRFAVLKENECLIRAGAGIVYDSLPEKEYKECYLKAQALFKAINISLTKEFV